MKRESGWEKKCPQANIREIVEAEVEFADIGAGGRQQAKQLVGVVQVAVGEVKQAGGGQEAGKTQLIVVQQHQAARQAGEMKRFIGYILVSIGTDLQEGRKRSG